MAIPNICDVNTFCEEMKSSKTPPHVALFPSAGMGPLMPFLRLARVLAVHHGFSVTFLAPQSNVSHSETVHLQALASSGLNIRVAEVEMEAQSVASPFGGTGKSSSDDPFFMQWEAVGRSLVSFRKVVKALLRPRPSSSSAPICAIVTDALLSTALDVTAELNLPNYIFVAASAFTLALMLHTPTFVSRPQDLYDEDAVLHIPGFPPLSARDIPDGLKNTDHVFFRVYSSCASRLPKAAAILIDTFDDLESEFLNALSAGRVVKDLPPIYPVGPTVLHSMQCSTESHIHPNTDADAARCLQWLDTQPAKSVLYVSFGSRSAMSAEQVNELAYGLENSGQRFLWILRRSVVATSASQGDATSMLPPGFQCRVKDRGQVVSCWLPQVRVLSHKAVGGFMSHCGWNSTMESVSCGIPVICWPLFGDQMMNKRVLVENGKAGVEIRKGEGGMVSRDEVERVVRNLMVEEEGKVLERRAIELRDRASRAIGGGGASAHNFRQLINAWKTIPDIHWNIH